MRAHLTIGKRGTTITALLYVCEACGETISRELAGRRYSPVTEEERAWFDFACKAAGNVVKAKRDCKRHNRQGRSRNI